MANPPASHQSPESSRRLRRSRLTRLILVALVLIYAVVFIVLNRGKVKIHFIFFTVTSRLWVGFLVCIALGVVLGLAIGVYRRRHRSTPDERDAGGSVR
jgi:uncharacterized integral membrane protein